MKGSLEGVLPMIGILLMAIVLSMQSIPLEKAMNDAVSDSTSDIETVVNTRAYADFYFYNYVPLAAEYAWNQVSYDLGQEGGGETWTKTWLDDYESNMQTLKGNVDSATSGNLSDTVDGSEGSCDIPDSEYRVSSFVLKTTEELKDLQDEEARLSVGHDTSTDDPTSVNPEPIETTCNFGGESYYQDEITFYSTKTNATDNRYLQLADESLRSFLHLKEELNKIDSSSGSKTACGTKKWASAEKKAVKDLDKKISDAISDVKNNFPKRNFPKIKKAKARGEYTFDHGTDSSELTKGDQTDDSTDVGDCDCNTICTGYWHGDKCKNGETYEYCDDEYKVEVEVSPKQLKLDWIIEDSERRVIVGDTYENLQFRVEPYEHNFQ